MGDKRHFIITEDRLGSVDYVDIMRLELEYNGNDNMWGVIAVLYNDDTIALASRNNFDDAYKAMYEILALYGTVIQIIPLEEAEKYKKENKIVEKSPDGED